MLSELPIVEFNIHFICLVSDQRTHKSNGRIWSLQQRNNELCIRSIYPLNCHFHWQNCVVASEWHVEKETSPRRNITSLYKMGDQKNSWMDKSKTSILFHVCDCVMCSVCVIGVYVCFNCKPNSIETNEIFSYLFIRLYSFIFEHLMPTSFLVCIVCFNLFFDCLYVYFYQRR